jgi:hypothetical protein
VPSPEQMVRTEGEAMLPTGVRALWTLHGGDPAASGLWRY